MRNLTKEGRRIKNEQHISELLWLVRGEAPALARGVASLWGVPPLNRHGMGHTQPTATGRRGIDSMVDARARGVCYKGILA